MGSHLRTMPLILADSREFINVTGAVNARVTDCCLPGDLDDSLLVRLNLSRCYVRVFLL